MFTEINQQVSMAKSTSFKQPNLIRENFTFPQNLHLLTMQPFFFDDDDTSIIIRIEHFYEKIEDAQYSEPVSYDLYDLLNGDVLCEDAIVELSLGANISIDNMDERLKWNSEDQIEPLFSRSFTKKTNTSYVITLNPMQIKTFFVSLCHF